MRTSFPPSVRLLGAALLASLLPQADLRAQTVTATTDPVGFVTMSIAGAPAGSSALSFKSLALARPVEYQGNAEDIVSPTKLQDTDSNWDQDQFNGANGAFYLEITGPANAAGIGTTYDITATDPATQTITLAQNLATGVADGATFRVRKHWTIASVFGAANEAGLQPGSATTADTIRVHSASGQYETYFYSNTGLPGTGWRNTLTGATDRATQVLYPDDGLLISRQQASAVNVVLMGSVKTGATSSPVSPGLNIIGNPYAAPMTLADSGLYTTDPATGVAAGSASTADLVQIYNGNGGYDTYYYSSGGLAGAGWRKSNTGATDQAGVVIPVGTSVIIQRKSATGFNWVAAQHPAAL